MTQDKNLLSEKEKEIVINSIKEGKTIPKEYLYKLAKDDEDVFLFWNGRSEEVSNVVLPFHSIEHIDEPRKEKIEKDKTLELFQMDSRGRQLTGWTNKLIWGDNKLILSSLVNGPLREEIEEQGGIKLIYIDPPFSVGQDYTIGVKINDEKASKKPSILEEFAYRNTWNRGASGFLSMIYERIKLIKTIISDDGCLVLRIDYHFSHYVKIILDDIFGKINFRNEIIINRTKKNVMKSRKIFRLPTSVESIFVYSKSDNFVYINPKKKLNKKRKGRWRIMDDSAGIGSSKVFFGTTISPPPARHFKYSQENINKLIAKGKIILKCNNCKYVHKKGNWTHCPKCKTDDPRPYYWVESKKYDILDTDWTDIPGYSFSTNYPTENSEQLLKRIIKASSNKGDIVCDFFCGSGTTAAVAEKLGRKWIVADLGRFAIHTTRKRMIKVQRELKEDGKDFRSFEILNLGKYERRYFLDVNPNFSEEEQQNQLETKQEQYISLILAGYKAKRISGFKTLHGQKGDRLVYVGPIDFPVTKSVIEDILEECVEKTITKVDVLGFEFEMGLKPYIKQDLAEYGVKLVLKNIPREVFDKRAVEKGQVKFYDVAYLEVEPKIKDKTVQVELKNFVTNYTQDDLKKIEQKMRKRSSKVVIENGQIIKISKSKDGIINRDVLTKHWYDWIDYWAVDFDYESKKEIIKIKENGAEVEKWTGNYIFENEWQSFRTKKNNQLEFVSAEYKYAKKGKYKIAVRVVDILGNDTLQIVEV